MKKLLLSVSLGICLLLGGCNRKVLDLTYSYEEAMIKLPDGTIIQGKVQSWRDYEGDQIQVKIAGKQYLVHSSNLVLISN